MPPVEIEIDLSSVIMEVLPGLLEIDRIEAIAAGKTVREEDFQLNGEEKDDEGPEGGESDYARMEGW